MRLREWEMPQFLRSLLHAEAEANGLPADDIHVAERFSAPDGGEDAHICWEGDPDRTPHLPARFTQFQIKTGDITPARAAKEVLTKDGSLKEMVRIALEAGAHYVLLCTQSLTAKKAQNIEKKIRESVRGVGLCVVRERIHVRDADQLAAWTNNYPALVAWLKERTRSTSTGPFRSWAQWADQPEHLFSPFVDDERLPALKTCIISKVVRPGTFVRVVGAAGVGKSRLAVESFRTPDDKDADNQDIPMHEFVLYSDQSEVEETSICGAVKKLADTGARAIVVVDDCPQRTHQRLVGMIIGPRSRLSLITIDNDEAYSASAHDSSTFLVDHAPPSVTEGIIDSELPSLSSEDRRRLLLFSFGFPAVAVRVASAWAKHEPIPYSTDMDFVEAFVTGRTDTEPDLAVKTAMLIAAFGTVRHPLPDSQAGDLSRWGRQITPQDMHVAIEELVDRGVVQRRGGLVVLQPRPVAMRLTERQWREWSREQRIELLTGDVDPHLKVSAARQLEWLNDTDVAKEVATVALRPNGPLDAYERLCRPGNASVLHHLAAIDAQLAVDCIGRALDEVTDLRDVDREIRRDLVETIERLAFPADTFDEAASVMLRLAVAETEHAISNNATGQFAALFPRLGGATEADGCTRIMFLRFAANTNDSRQRAVVVNALLAGIKMSNTRWIGAETHGSRPALEPWVPPTRKDAVQYVTACVELLTHEAIVDDEVGREAKTGLGLELRSLVSFGLIDDIERVANDVCIATGGWSEAIKSLGHFIRFDADRAAPGVAERAHTLIETLGPTTLSDRIHDLVSNMPWDYPLGENLDYDEQARRQIETVHSVAADALSQPPVLRDHVPKLCRGSQRWAGVFGEFLGARIDSPKDWLQRIATAIQETPDEEQNFDLLAGFLKGLSERDSDTVDAFKRHVAESPDLARSLPSICSRLGLTDGDIPLAVDALRAGLLPPWSLRLWSFGGGLSNMPIESLPSLLDELIDHGTEGVFTAVDMIGMIAHGDHQRLDALRSQITELARSIVHADLLPHDTMIDYHATTVLGWLLDQGRNDDDACALALILSSGFADGEVSHCVMGLISPLLPHLLSGFPEIAWPLIGQRLMKQDFAAWHIHNVLAGADSVHDDSSPPILSLPADTLFAWCGAHPEEAPACAAQMLPFLSSDHADGTEPSLHPLFRRLLDEFGDREDVLEAGWSNMHSFTWSGSLTTYFARYLGPLETLHDHPIPRVARWAKRMGRLLEREIKQESARDDEYEASWEI
ncbi:MAG: hypothetical protein OXH52_19460 [Gammaproteobacteria bacterium]|nr:hypothetical protein [Gammaproteobacteria bacterium]